MSHSWNQKFFYLLNDTLYSILVDFMGQPIHKFKTPKKYNVFFPFMRTIYK